MRIEKLAFPGLGVMVGSLILFAATGNKWLLLLAIAAPSAIGALIFTTQIACVVKDPELSVPKKAWLMLMLIVALAIVSYITFFIKPS